MLTFLAKYATAAHLALLTVAPLFLFPFCGEGEIAKVLLWLSLLCAAWIIMSPSTIFDEHPHDARVRFVSEVVRDPLFWFSLLFVLVTGVRALNGGVGFTYDAEAVEWTLSNPVIEILPGCVDGAGFLPFATTVALSVLLIAFRHALDREAIMSFIMWAAVFVGISAVVAIVAFTRGHDGIAAMLKCDYKNPSFIGVAYGVHLIVGITALFHYVETRQVIYEMLTAISVILTTLGFAVFSPALTLVSFAGAFLVIVAISYALHGRDIAGAGSLRCTIAVLAIAFAAVAPFVLYAPTFGIESRGEDIMALQLLPAGFADVRSVLSGIALKVWKSGPWLGSGLGSFSLDMRFVATPQDWIVISPLQKASLNGWWQLLVERGVVGMLMFVTMLGFMMWTYVSSMIAKRNRHYIRSVNCVGLLIAMVLLGLAFVDCSLLRTDVLLAGGAALALSAAAFPAQRRANSKEE